LNSSHRVRVLGRELQVRSEAPAEAVQEVEAFVNGKLAEVAASVKTADSQIVAILTLMNIAEAYLALTRENEFFRQQGNEKISRLLQRLESNLE
jgi:cell division protein ZapA (FtsZ GTPase activity inhibitor)